MEQSDEDDRISLVEAVAISVYLVILATGIVGLIAAIVGL